MGDDKFVAVVLEPVDEIDGRLNSLALNNPGRLQDHSIIGGKSYGFPENLGPPFADFGWVFKIQNIGNDDGGDPGPQCQLLLGFRINHHMPDIG